MDKVFENKIKNDRYARLAIRNNDMYIDKIERTPEGYLEAVKKNGLILRDIPKKLQNVHICHEAIKQNGIAIKWVSKKILTDDLCLEAVRNNGNSIDDIPEEFRTKKLYLEAIKKNGLVLKVVPDKYKSERICRMATMQNGLALEFVSKKILSKELFVLAVEQNGLSLEFVPNKYRSKKLCITAVENNELALRYIPDKYKTVEMCNKAINSNWKSFLYVLDSMYTLNNCLEIFKQILKENEEISKISYSDCSYIRDLALCLPDNIRNDIQIIRLERQLKLRKFKKKYFDKETYRFITIEEIYYREEDERKEFDMFIDFCKHLDMDLKNANLLDYDFTEIRLTDFNIEDAYINSDVLIEQHLYDDSFYEINIKSYDSETELMNSAKNEVVEAISILHDSDLISNTMLNDTSRKMYYISDIHLNHKLSKEFPTNATELEVKMYIRKIIEKMMATATESSYDDFLLLAGDISFNFEISALFYKELVQFWRGPIVAVLGNHELWNCNQYGDVHSVNEIIQQYRALFSSLHITFLQNDLLLSNGEIILENQLKSIDEDKLKNICMKSPFVILGGLGFSGLNSQFNATHGIYHQTITSMDEDIKYTNQFHFIYNKVKSTLGNDKVIILTHTPKENWSNEEYNSSWIYVNGHTHRNDYCSDEEKTFYSDNQIGYYSTSIGLKYFKISKTYDIFKYYLDGIYLISREEYLKFNHGIKISITFNGTGNIHMLKNNNLYCFILKKQNTNKLQLLEGGRPRNLKYNDLNYYYERMPYYANAIKELFNDYNQSLKYISKWIKKIGGIGTIHGSIVDIDYYNHIYVNPLDGCITPYFATSMVDKYVYPHIKALLLAQRKDLYDNYMKLLKSESKGVKLLEGEMKIENIEISVFNSDTSIYRPSKIIKSLQYLTEVNVIRVWNDSIFDSNFQNGSKIKSLCKNSEINTFFSDISEDEF